MSMYVEYGIYLFQTAPLPIWMTVSMDLNSISPALQRLDPQALTEVHDRFYPVVYRYVQFRLEDTDLVEDITSEVFLALIKTLRSRPKSIQNLQAWLLGTASNQIHDYLRKKYRRKIDPLEDQEWIEGDERTEERVDQVMQSRQVREVFQNLTEDQQRVLALRFSQELSIEDTARATGKSISAVKVIQFRALAAIRRLLETR